MSNDENTGILWHINELLMEREIMGRVVIDMSRYGDDADLVTDLVTVEDAFDFSPDGYEKSDELVAEQAMYVAKDIEAELRRPTR